MAEQALALELVRPQPFGGTLTHTPRPLLREVEEPKAKPEHDRGPWLATLETARQLRTVAQAVEPRVLQALNEEEQPGRLRSIADSLIDHTLEFLNEIVSRWGVEGRKPRRYNQTFEAALRDAVRRGFHVGDLAEFARAELLCLRARLESVAGARSVLILECANAIGRVRATAGALEAAARRGQPPCALASSP